MNDFLSGFPPPPCYYKNYTLKNEEGNNLSISEDGKFEVFEYEDHLNFNGPIPPSLPKYPTWFSFGTQEKLIDELAPLDSETLIVPKEADLRVHFKSLYGEFMDSLLRYLNSLKSMNMDYISDIKRFTKLYINLQYVLQLLAVHQAREDVLNALKEQIKRRRRHIDFMKHILIRIKEHIENFGTADRNGLDISI